MMGGGGRWVILVSLVTTAFAAVELTSLEHGGHSEVVARQLQDPCFGICSGSRECVVSQDGRPFCVDCTGLLKRKKTGTPFAECCTYDAENLTCASALRSTAPGVCKRSQQLFARIPQDLPEDDLSSCNDVEPVAPTASNKDACLSAQFFLNSDLACDVRRNAAGRVQCFNRDGTVDRTCRPKPKFVQVGQDIDGTDSDERLGYSVAMSSDGTRMIVGSLQYGQTGRLGRAQVYELRDGEGWVKLGKDLLEGWSVAMSADGKRVAVGQLLDDTVRVYKYAVSGRWVQVGQNLVSPGAGWSVVFSADGKRVAVGSTGADGVNGSASGSVHVYDLRNGRWFQVGGAIDGEAKNDASGFSLAMSSNGKRLAIGAIANNNLGGHVRVFRFVKDQGWIQLGQDIDGSFQERLGWSVAMSNDGSRVAIGAPGQSNVRVYDYKTSGRWAQVGEKINEGVDSAGSSVALSADGKRLVVGAQYSSSNGRRSGVVHVYDFMAGKGWTKLSREIVGRTANENVGGSVAVTADGNRVLVGAPENSVNGPGHTRVFQLVESC